MKFWKSKKTVKEVAELFLAANKNRWKPGGKADRMTFRRYKFVCNRYLITMFGNLKADDFKRHQLKEIRDQMVREGNLCKPGIPKARSTINNQIKIVFCIFEWATNRDLVSDETLFSLAHLTPLKAGEEKVNEPKKIVSAKKEDIENTIKYLPQPTADMVRVQYLTGMRNGEVCHLRKCDIIIEDSGLWRYVPYTHKTETKGKVRVIFLGPKSQEILRPYHDGSGAEEFFFSPLKTMEYLYRNSKRRRGIKRVFHEKYSSLNYYAAIKVAVKKAMKNDGIPYWHPHQLRHAFATRTAHDYGTESAKESLGHSSLKTTERYMDPTYDRAREIAVEIG